MGARLIASTWTTEGHKFVFAEDPLWERACSRMRCVIQQLWRLAHCIREQGRSHRVCAKQQQCDKRHELAALPLSLIPQRNNCYHSKPSSAVPVSPLACAHSLLLSETRYEPSQPSAPRHRDNDPRHGAAVCLLLRCHRCQHLLRPTDHRPDRAGQHHGQPDRFVDSDRLRIGSVLPGAAG